MRVHRQIMGVLVVALVVYLLVLVISGYDWAAFALAFAVFMALMAIVAVVKALP
jgi:hypothetical protein